MTTHVDPAVLEAPLPGDPFELIEVYVAHDGAKLFSMASTSDPSLVFMVNAVEESETGDMTYLVGELDRAALDSVRFGHVPLRYAFSERAEANAVYVVSVSYGDDGELVSAHRTSIVDVPVDWLPVKDVRLGRD